MGFAELFSQPPAPIEERMAAGVPQAPIVQAAPMVNPAGGGMPPAPQRMQAQTGSTQAPAQAPDPKAVGRWEELLSRITQPDVMGPLQTFLAAAAAPLQPGENMGARIGYAGTLMQLHRSMLQENARLAPQLAEERELKLQEMRGKIAQTEAATESSRATTKGTQLTNKFNEETYETRLEKAKQDLVTAKQHGKAEDIRLAREQLQQVIDEQTGLHKAQLGIQEGQQRIAESKSREAFNNRLPKEGAGKATKNPKFSNLSDDGFRRTFESSIRKPFFDWSAAKKANNEPHDWASFMAESKNVAQINEMIDEASARGMPMEWLTQALTAPTGASGKPGGKRYIMGADGQMKEAK